MTIDSAVNAAVQAARAESFDFVFLAISYSVYLLAAICIFYIYKESVNKLISFLIGGGLLFVLTALVKEIVSRPRPDLSNGFSFPSRHAAFAFFLAASLPLQFKWRFLVYVWAVLIVFSRLWLNVHWFSDILFGAGIGFIIAFIFKNEKINKLTEKLVA